MLAVKMRPILRLETIGVIRCVSVEPAVNDVCILFPTQQRADGDASFGNV